MAIRGGCRKIYHRPEKGTRREPLSPAKELCRATTVARTIAYTHGEFMNRLLIGILLFLTAPLYAQAQQPDTAKLKADAQKVVSIIRGDKAKTQAYCQLDSIGEQIDEATEAKDTKKVDALNQQGEELEKKLGPEFRTLFDALNDADPDSQDVKDILSMLDTLAESCPD
jgi:fructose-bisphosphate aldolase class 1